MLFLWASIFMSVMMITQASVEDDVSLTTEEKAIYIFDVTTDASLSDLSNVYEHKFQVVGTNRYLLVSQAGKSNSDFILPAGSVMEQMPVEYVTEFFEMFDVTGWDDQDFKGKFNNSKLAVIIWDFLADKDMDSGEYAELMKAYGNLYKVANNKVKPASYAVIGRVPHRIYYFMDLDDQSMETAIEDGLKVLKGPGNARIRTYHLEKMT